jgi:GLPGLI family protein
MIKLTKIFIFLSFYSICHSQNLEITYEYHFLNGKMVNEVVLKSNDSLSQFICDFKKKTLKIDYYEVEQEAKFYVNNFYHKTMKSNEVSYFKNKKFYSEWYISHEWIITDELDEFLGYKIQKAFYETNTRNGKVYAWFTTDIPIPSGPFRYNGLPGLILKVLFEKANTKILCKKIEEVNTLNIDLLNNDNAIVIEKDIMIEFNYDKLNEILKN